MMKCKKHAHTTEARAVACLKKTLARRAAMKAKYFKPPGVKMITYEKGRITKHGEVWMIVFSEDANMPY